MLAGVRVLRRSGGLSVRSPLSNGGFGRHDALASQVYPRLFADKGLYASLVGLETL